MKYKTYEKKDRLFWENKVDISNHILYVVILMDIIDVFI